MRKKLVNYYADVTILVPFVIKAWSGMLLQIVYHMGERGSDFVALGLNQSGWSVIHKISSITSILGVGLHVILHLSWFKAVIGKRLFLKRSYKKKTSFYLSIVCGISAVLGFASWLFGMMGYPSTRHTLVEMHDKVSPVLVILLCVHLIKSSRWLLNTTRQIMFSKK